MVDGKDKWRIIRRQEKTGKVGLAKGSYMWWLLVGKRR
jgi:hypothetical protein